MVKRVSRYNLVDASMSTPPPKILIDLNEPHVRPINRRMHHGKLFWTEISWRLMATLIFSIAITAVLHSFSLKGILSRWEKRWFNALAILLSSLVSMSTGSLLGLLGSMIRWPLLARKPYTPVDADLILGMSNPTVAVKLIWIHTVHKRKWCVATIVVAVYLLVNIIGRLSVAAFGLTFDLNEEPRIEYPNSLTDWGTKRWFNDSMLSSTYGSPDFSTAYDFLDQNLKRMNRYATIGLSNVPGDDFDWKNSSTYNMTNINGHGLNRVIEGENVTYSYYLKEYRGQESTPSTTSVLHSSSRCVGGTVSLLVSNEMVLVDFSEIIHNITSQKILRKIFGIYTISQDDVIWIAPLNTQKLYEDSACATTYLYTESYLDVEDQNNRNAALFECHTCTSHNDSIPGLGLLESSHSTTYNVSSLLHRIGYFDRVWDGDEGDDSDYGIRTYSGMDKNEHFANQLNNAVKKDQYKLFNPKDGIPFEGKLHAAHLAARLPLLAIMGADIQLPKVTQIPGASEQRFVDIRLNVKLKKPIAVLICIFVGQILAIGVVLFCCRKVFIRDYTSNLSIGKLLKTTMKDVEGMSTCTGEELMQYLDSKGVMLRYGTRRNGDEALEVDLWNDVEDEFPDTIYA